MRIWMLPALMLLLASCATHTAYDGAELREQPIGFANVALHEGGLTPAQIAMITSTKRPTEFPVDVAIILATNGYVDRASRDTFAYGLVQGLKQSDHIGRVTLLPRFIIPPKVGFSEIQELGVRSLSEYVLVFYLDGSEMFQSTKILSSKYEISSEISFILVDSGTTALMTADRLVSKQVYEENVFESKEAKAAKKQIFGEQAQLLALKLDELFTVQ